MSGIKSKESIAIGNFDQIVSISKGNVEALVQSSTATVKGIEELAKFYATVANQAVEQTSAAIKALSVVKTPQDFQSVVTDLAKHSFETFVSETRKAQELASSILTGTLAPITDRAQSMVSFVNLLKAA
jgi:phasin family protein